MPGKSIEDLLKEQDANAASLQQAINNYKKSPLDRKTELYILKQLENIDKLWKTFEKLDNRFRNDLSPNHEYFNEDKYAEFGKKYNDIRSKMDLELVELRNPAINTCNVQTENTSIKNEIEKQKKVISTVKCIVNQVLNAPTGSINFYKQKLKIIEQHWKHAITMHERLFEYSTYDYETYINNEEIITNGIIQIEEMIANGETIAPTIPSSNRNNNIQLPKIELPKFDGDYLKWRNFYDLFSELVDKTSLASCQKLLYLKSSLSGEAESLIHNFATTADNYEIAWTTLKTRYENKRVLVNSILKRLLAQPASSNENVASLKLLHDTTQESLQSLQNLGISTENWDPFMVHIIVQRLSKITHVLWEQSLLNPQTLPKLSELMTFIKTRFQSLEALGDKTPTHHGQRHIKSFGASLSNHNNCILCQAHHQLFACQLFLRMSPKDRLRAVQSANLCVNCLKPGHIAKNCNSSSCTICNKKHNTLLHLGSNDSKSKQSSQNEDQPSSSTAGFQVATSAVGMQSPQSTCVLLSTICLNVTDFSGKKHQCRALLDSGSQANFISKKLAHQLGLNIDSSIIGIEGIGQSQSHTSGRINVEIASTTTAFSKRIEVHVIKNIVSVQPAQHITTVNWKIPTNVRLADNHFNKASRVDMLIGAGIFYSILSIGQISLGPGLPTLQNTVFGWVVSGEYNCNDLEDKVHCGVSIASNIDENLERFWQLEEVETQSKTFTANERKCENHFLQNIRKHTDGRFIVKLPFEGNPNKLGESRDIALQRFLSIERKLDKNPTLRSEYNKFMKEYELLNHMSEIPVHRIPTNHYFLPHHAVFKMDSTTTKTRVVFDASAKTSTNYSLNDLLSTGPTIQSDVFTNLLRFRFPRYAFTADIEKMYRQIWVSQEDRAFQLIWWRENSTLPLRCMQLATVTYGTTCAPFLATRTLQMIAETNIENYALAANAIKNNFYVDDVLTGSDKVSIALELQHQLREVLQSAGISLRKWCANDERLLTNIPAIDREVSLDITASAEENIKTMGITWFPKKDVFSIKISQETAMKVTKRTALADISRLFDPMGLVAPVVVTAKIFLQTLWKLKLDWDAALPHELYTKWLNFRDELTCLQQINIPRHIFDHKVPKDVQLHIFADASEVAYGAVAYVRTIDLYDTLIVRLLCSKSRVAPVKQITLPRLELCAAKLATDLAARLKEDKIMPNCPTYFWSDSTAVLGWINASSSNYHTFVANRISAIQQISTPQQWHHVRSDQNPADIISRGIMPQQMINNTLWFYGPIFLHAPLTSWPLQPPRQNCELEIRQKTLTSLITVPDNTNYFETIKHGNSLRKLQRIMAYVYRFTKVKRTTTVDKATSVLAASISPPSAIEMEKALLFLVKMTQQTAFTEEMKSIRKNNGVQPQSSISSLSPFIDENGILRVGGRLQASNLSHDAKHQMLLPYHHSLTKMIFGTIHKENQHVGAQTLLSMVRQRFWPLRGKNIARSTVQSCIFCTKSKPKLFEQLMGALPRDRVQPARPFINTGVDFFGPVWVHFKIRGKKPLKSYVAVFCCFATKAVHLELVSDLTTEAFLGALKRFIARRGHCNKLYCDNATNFVGAKNQLKELTETLFPERAHNQIYNECNKRNIQFSFIPPRAPHFGGLWEAAVKSAKHLLYSALTTAKLSHEEMETFLAETEAIMNSRPLTPLSADPNDLAALTPGHFLIGEPLTAITDPNAIDRQLQSVTRWRLITQLKKEFWQRWTNEYLHTLQHRYKWKKEVYDITPGTMVLVKEDNVPSFQWTLGRIKNVIKGDDGLVRVADVQTAKNVIRRAITKLAPLPVEINNSRETSPSTNCEPDDSQVPQSKRPKLAPTCT